MNLQRLIPLHQEDRGELKNPQLFVTDDYRLLVQGTCRNCGKQVKYFFPLTYLYKLSLGQAKSPPSYEVPSPIEFTATDRRELQAMHISVPEDEETH
jgi:hypothetical protein